MPEKIIKNWLSLLGIPVSASLLKDQLKSHPDYPSLLSITDTLDYLGITNTAVQVEKEVLQEIDTPFLAHLKSHDDGFMVFENGISPEKKYPSFFENWSGVIVMAEKPENWSHNSNAYLLRKEQKQNRVLLICTCAVAAIAVTACWLAADLTFTGLMMLAMAGIFISRLIVSKELGIANNIADQVCGKGKECSEVVQSKGAKLPFGAGLSDISLLWFIGLFAGLSFTSFNGNGSGMIRLVSILSLASVPVIVYSLFYQAFVIRKWCRLCLITVALLAVQLAITLPALIKSGWQFPVAADVLVYATILFATGLGWFSFKALFKRNSKLEEDFFKGVRFKRTEKVFSSLLERQRKALITPFENDLQIGNRLAPVQITVACNPYCGPCAAKHEKLHELLENNEENTGITIRFTVPAEQKDNKVTKTVAHFFSHILFHSAGMNSIQRSRYTRKMLHDWFRLMDYNKFSELYPAGKDDVSALLHQQQDWCHEAEIKYTPTIFINGIELPHSYSIEDIPGIMHAVPAINTMQKTGGETEIVASQG